MVVHACPLDTQGDQEKKIESLKPAWSTLGDLSNKRKDAKLGKHLDG